MFIFIKSALESELLQIQPLPKILLIEMQLLFSVCNPKDILKIACLNIYYEICLLYFIVFYELVLKTNIKALCSVYLV